LVPVDFISLHETDDGKRLYDNRFCVTTVNGYTSIPKSLEAIASDFRASAQIFCNLNTINSKAIYIALNEEDPLKQFLYFAFFLERFTNSEYKEINRNIISMNEAGFIELCNSIPERLRDSTSEEISESEKILNTIRKLVEDNEILQIFQVHRGRISEELQKCVILNNISGQDTRKYDLFLKNLSPRRENLAQKFLWCSIFSWSQISGDDISSFSKVKKMRDKLAHGVEVDESSLPIEEAKKLSLKLIKGIAS
jgi:hypothetical protein